MDNIDDNVQSRELGSTGNEQKDEQEGYLRVIPSIAEKLVGEIVAGAKVVIPESPEERALEIETLRAEIAKIWRIEQAEKINTNEATFLRSCFNLLGDFPDKEKWELFWVENILSYGGALKEIEIFFKNISKSALLRDTLCTKDIDINGSLTEVLTWKTFDST